QQVLANPSVNMSPVYAMASVAMKDGTTLCGYLRAQGSHDVVVQTKDGKLHPLLDSQYTTITPDSQSAMAAYHGTADQQRDLLAYLSTLNGVGVGPLKQAQTAVTKEQVDAVAHPAKGNWPNYNGTTDGNRNSGLDQINLKNVAKLQLQWAYPINFNGLET